MADTLSRADSDYANFELKTINSLEPITSKRLKTLQDVSQKEPTLSVLVNRYQRVMATL